MEYGKSLLIKNVDSDDYGRFCSWTVFSELYDKTSTGRGILCEAPCR